MSVQHWASLTTEELAQVDRDALVIQPLGAIEQHGPHLPLDTDTRIVEGLLEHAVPRIERDLRVPVLVLPTLAIGTSDEHKSFPGTLGLDAPALIDALVTIGRDVARSGFERLVWVNGHGGNRAVMDLAALALRRDPGLRVVKCTYTRLGAPPVDWPADELARGFHGGALETAILRFLHPEVVREDRVGDFRSEAAAEHRLVDAEGPANWAWLAEDLHRSGAIGDARLGTVEDGRRLVEFYAEGIARVLSETASLPALRR